MKSNKHDEGKRKGKSNEPREADTALAPEKHDRYTHHKGETLPGAQRVYRTQVVLTLMEAGIPLSKLDCPGLRALLKNGYRLTDSRHMIKYES